MTGDPDPPETPPETPPPADDTPAEVSPERQESSPFEKPDMDHFNGSIPQGGRTIELSDGPDQRDD